MTFIDYLYEKGFITEDEAKYLIPKHLYKTAHCDAKEREEHDAYIHNLTECLIIALQKLENNPTAFIIKNRPENRATVRHILNDPNVRLDTDVTKEKIINFVLSQNLYKSFSKFEPHHEGKDTLLFISQRNSLNILK